MIVKSVDTQGLFIHVTTAPHWGTTPQHHAPQSITRALYGLKGAPRCAPASADCTSSDSSYSLAPSADKI